MYVQSITPRLGHTHTLKSGDRTLLALKVGDSTLLVLFAFAVKDIPLSTIFKDAYSKRSKKTSDDISAANLQTVGFALYQV